MNQTSLTLEKANLDRNFRYKGAIIAIISGILYGLYTTFLTLGMTKGVWGLWYAPEQAVLSAFVIVYVIGALGSAVNDTCSAAWAAANAAAKGKLAEWPRYLATKPGKMMVLAAILGGPIATSCYVIALQMAGTIIVPVTALCPALGAIFQRIFYKAPLRPHMIVGIAICVLASALIGMTGLGGDAPEGLALGLCFAFLAAVAWGLEGCIGGYSTALVDYEISILIRQSTSGLTNLFILVPILSLVAGDIGISWRVVSQAFTDTHAMPIFLVSGFFAWITYMLWYHAISMCGAALAMSCNGMYSFWAPFFCWIILGLVLHMDGYALAGIAWVAAILMVVGIFVIAINPKEMFRRKAVEGGEET